MRNALPKPLTIYMSSAGSGKTYRLVENYLLLSLDKDPKKYSRILAITFTRKATAEMRLRIINQLYILSDNPKESGHLSTLTQKLEIDEKELAQRAKRVLINLLHNYSNFSISTIDQFFQRILRSTARELNIPGLFRIEMNDALILDRAVMQFLENAATNNGNNTQPLLLDFIESEIISQNQRYNIKRKILATMKKMMRENIKDRLITLWSDKDNDRKIITIIETLSKEIKEYEQNQTSLRKKLDDAVKNTPLYQFYRKTGNKHDKLLKFGSSENTKIEEINEILQFPEELSCEDVFTKNAAKNKEELDEFFKTINPTYKQLLTLLKEQYPKYVYYREILPTFWQIRLFRYVWEEVNQISTQENIFLLSNTPILLKQITQNTHTPFIYEKLGSWYKHFMIDEFQDTSLLQWENIKPFIQESMSQFDANSQKCDVNNLIIGDVKQAIYRFRNGDWTLLQHKVGQQLQNLGIDLQTLAQNWRSEEVVVNFNNDFFDEVLKRIVDEQFINKNNNKHGELLKAIYCDSKQEFSKEIGGKGYVSIELLGNTKSDDENDNTILKTYKEATLEKIAQTVQMLLANKVSAGDIAILTRTRKNGKIIIDYLLSLDSFKQSLQISTDDVLTLDQSDAVNAIISIIQDLAVECPNTFYRIIAARLIDFVKQENNLTLFEDPHTHPAFKIIADKAETWKQLPLYDLVLEIISCFELNKCESEVPYLQGLLGIIVEFGQNSVSDKTAFLDFWESKGASTEIPTPYVPDALKVMTIHKSKGLEFKHVIVPFVDWQVSNPNDPIWVEKEFNSTIYPLLVNPSEKKLNTPVGQEVAGEIFNRYVDSLNLLYVAFTRAELSLHIFSNIERKNSLVSNWIRDFVFTKKIDSQENTTRYVQGELETASPKQSETATPLVLTCFGVNSNIQLKIRCSESNQVDQYPLYENIPPKIGSLLHKILEQIITIADLDTALNRVVRNGQINQSQRDEIKSLLETAFENPTVQQWYSKGIRVINERSIIKPTGSFSRPDRIIQMPDGGFTVIDYKFTQKQHTTHNQQVLNYLDLLKESGYNVAGGYVWYVLQNIVVKVG